MTFRVIKGGGVFTERNPWRQHHNRNGRVKQSLASREEAEQQAHQQSADTGYEYSPYRCDLCCQWHVGATRRYLNFWNRELEDMEIELGRRVAAHIKLETLHPYGAIRKRCITALRHQMR